MGKEKVHGQAVGQGAEGPGHSWGWIGGAMPVLYVTVPGATVRQSGESLLVTAEKYQIGRAHV